MKKTISFLLALVILSYSIPAMASEGDHFPMDAIAKEEGNMVDDSLYDENGKPSDLYFEANTISFSETVLPESISTLDATSAEDAQKAIALAHNQDVAKQAREYVQSLNLTQRGLSHIEKACLDELDYYMSLEDGQLLSYTVYTPKSTSTTASVPSDLLYFGTFGGRDFYYNVPASALVQSNVEKEDFWDTLVAWSEYLIDLYLIFSQIEAITVWSDVLSAMNAPTGYTVREGAFVQSFANLNIYTRYIYTVYGAGSYEPVTSQQFCEVYPYAVFHPVDSPLFDGSYNIEHGYRGQAYSPKYRNSKEELCKQAFQVYFGAWDPSAHDKIGLSAFRTIWK